MLTKTYPKILSYFHYLLVSTQIAIIILGPAGEYNVIQILERF